MATLPQELYGQIVQWTQTNTQLALAQTSKAFQRGAESQLYQALFLRDANVAYKACVAVTTRDGERGPYLRKFWFYHRTNNRVDSLPERLWLRIKAALDVAVNLEILLMYDPALTNTWVLSATDIKFQLQEANLGLQWDKTLVEFLETQEGLTYLHVEDSLEDGPLAAISPGKLQSLKTFQGPPLVVAELLTCPLTHLQVEVENETAAIVPTVMLDVGRIMKNLRSLHIVYLPEQMALELFQLISSSAYAPTLQFLGALPYPMQNRYEVHRCLMKLYSLELIELDVTAWAPQPYDCYQRMLAAELRTFCPKIAYVGLWIGNLHCVWIYQDEEWTSTRASGRLPQQETLWRNWPWIR
ncbi:uncharacterized protein C8Q71DRAFT_303444 [Rhodofomes roseus]|uniref:F-box domain-containing protein n=1 Tax=Rhodofomes roseus TaxID=34475 RepID=A0ABQ8K3L0_9APHY|nr:uncharacterized protein C8Q71DRAFT_303444 [Rhodofomes roseus]KAH9831430.1 hypothetical protein C8Q71DRAFT_303444 [Rhodofomes roseus]